MGYEALYRKYRPARFFDVVGQEHITSTLKNQVASGRIAHAYLFCGTRGTGKTSTARIFARAINCLSPKDGEPCGKCEACLSSSSLDIIEIDGGSNSRVDEVRDLLEKVRFAPVACRYKVYIIDEVHTLSKEAFTALLKTLEEPPAHVVFLLATTEPNKLPATIHSRCQRFDFHRVSTPNLVARLKYVLGDVGATYDEDGLRAIALAGQGSVRDTLSIADECLAFCRNDLTGAKVRAVLGGVSKQALFTFVDSLIDGDCVQALKKFDRIVSEGAELPVFIRDLSGHFRDLMVISSCGADKSLVECTEEELAEYVVQANRCPVEKSLRAIDLLSSAESTMKWLARPRVAIEAALVRISRPQEESASIETLTERVSHLEERSNREPLLTPKVLKPVGPAASEPITADLKTAGDSQPEISDEPFSSEEGALSGDFPCEADGVLSREPRQDADAIYNVILASMPGMLQPVLAKWRYRMRGGRLELLVPKEMQGRLGRLTPLFDDAMGSIRQEHPGLDAAMVSEDASFTEQKNPGLKELGEQIFGKLS